MQNLLTAVKENLILEHDEDDTLLLGFITASIDYAEKFQHLAEGYYAANPMPPSTRQAVILMASHFYESRDGTTANSGYRGGDAGQTAMNTVNALLRMNREWKV